MLHVFHERDQVILDLVARRKDVFLSPLQASNLAEKLDKHAARVEASVERTLWTRQPQVWNLRVLSYDRQVVIRLWPPDGVTTDRIPLSIGAARGLAGYLRNAAIQAGYGMRFETTHALIEIPDSYRLSNPAVSGRRV